MSKGPGEEGPSSRDQPDYKTEARMFSSVMNSTKLAVLLLLCMQNTLFTVMRRYSQGVLREQYSKVSVAFFVRSLTLYFGKPMTDLASSTAPCICNDRTCLCNSKQQYEVLLVGELIKIVYSSFKIAANVSPGEKAVPRLQYLLRRSGKMAVLACIYGAMNILSFVALRNISAGMFTIFAQLKILTTATCSTVMLGRSYSMTKWRALISLMMGVLLFSEPIWNNSERSKSPEGGNVVLGTMAVLTEVTLSGFASIYFEKVIKTDPEQLGIWERNYQLAFGSVPIYLMFMMYDGGGDVGFGGGWSIVAMMLAILGAAGGLLVALSIKHGDSILKTLATTGAIVFSASLDHLVLGGPLTSIMMIAGVQVVLSICNYTFDQTPAEPSLSAPSPPAQRDEEMQKLNSGNKK